MEKSKHQILSIIITILVGIGIGYFVTNTNRQTEIDKLKEEHKKELKHEIDLAQKAIKGRDLIIRDLENKVSQDSLEIDSLQKVKVKVSTQTEKKREEVRNLSADEKVKFLIDRYSNKPQ